MAKASLSICTERQDNFQGNMANLFSIFRGESKHYIEDGFIQAYIQLDTDVDDGFIAIDDRKLGHTLLSIKLILNIYEANGGK